MIKRQFYPILIVIDIIPPTNPNKDPTKNPPPLRSPTIAPDTMIIPHSICCRELVYSKTVAASTIGPTITPDKDAHNTDEEKPIIGNIIPPPKGIPIIKGIILHFLIGYIHPFEDGNGRTARTIMNFILMNKGVPMFFIPFEKREEYYNTLEQADKGNSKGYVASMLQLIIDQIRAYGHNKNK